MMKLEAWVVTAGARWEPPCLDRLIIVDHSPAIFYFGDCYCVLLSRSTNTNGSDGSRCAAAVTTHASSCIIVASVYESSDAAEFSYGWDDFKMRLEGLLGKHSNSIVKHIKSLQLTQLPMGTCPDAQPTQPTQLPAINQQLTCR